MEFMYKNNVLKKNLKRFLKYVNFYEIKQFMFQINKPIN